jgi:AcrR family transcriptional regulator
MRFMEETRKRILDAAMNVFAEFGFFKAPARLIAEKAGVSKGLIFWYFKRKDDLISEIASRALPVDIIENCLSKDVERKELLRCIGSSYISKYSDERMKKLLIHSISASSSYPLISKMLDRSCGEMLRRVALRVFGKDDKKSIIRMRAFFGSLLCYVLNRPQEIEEKEYIDEIISLVYHEK